MAATLTLEERQQDRVFIGHPRGLAYLAFAEAWERFSYYGMQTLLVLYMVGQLLQPGHVGKVAGFAPFRRMIESATGPLSVQALASAIFGLYAGFVYLTPIAGGLVADRLLGKTRTVAAGAILMAIGHFLMAFDVSFLIALLCLLVGVGGFKGNIAAQVGELYAPGDLRRADAFQIYYIGINAAVIVSPLICGTLGEVYGWHYGFGAAGVGMVIGLAIYLSGRHWLPPDTRPLRGEPRAPRAALHRQDWKTILVLVALVPVLAAASVGNMQIFNAYLLWGRDSYDFLFMGFQLKTTWLVSLDAALSTACLIGTVAFWRWWAARRPEPDEITKIAIGTLISVGGLLALAFASWLHARTGQRVSLAWAIAFHFINSVGFSNIFPVSLALYGRAAPRAVAGTMIGVLYLFLFLANLSVGWLGGLLDTWPGVSFWLLHAGIVTAAGLVFLLMRKAFGAVLAPRGETEDAARG